MQNRNRACTAVFLTTVLFLTLLPPPSFTEGTELSSAEQAADLLPEQTTVHITSAEDLIRMAEDCRLDTASVGKTYVLDRDIDLGGVPFTAVPTFSGTFDGQNHRITGFVLAGDGSHQGFFRYVQKEGIVKRLTVEGTVTPGNSRCQVGGIAGANNGRISSCRFIGTVEGLNYVGGIAGVNYGKITDCCTEGTVSGKRFTGGICGYSEGTVSGSRNDASVNVTVTEGGLELDNLNLTNYSDTLSLISAEDTSVVSDTGGIAGFSSGIISRCRNTGAVGYPHYGYNAGGIVGRQSGYTFSCVNNGAVTGRKDIGGICGQMEPDLLLNRSRSIADEINTLTVLVNNALTTLDDSTGTVSSALDSLGQFCVTAFGDLSEMSERYAEAVGTELSGKGGSDISSYDVEELEKALAELYAASDSGELDADAEQLEALLFYLGTAMDDATDLALEDLKKVNAQGGVVLNMLSSALAGDTDIRVYDDVSEEDGDGNRNGRVEKCSNNGSVSGDTDVGGISGAMAIEYEFDMEGSLISTLDEAIGSKGSIVSSTIRSRCICIANVNNGTVTGKKDCVGGINGLQDSGYITKCENYGNVTSTDGGYVGGIAGESCSVSDCCALCTLYGQEYVGGISGYGEKIMNCSAIVQMDGVTACCGAIAGYLDSVDGSHLCGNTFVSDRLGAVDGISYSGLAEPVDYNDYAADETLPELFRSVKLVFRAEDTLIAEIPVPYGGSISDEQIPTVPEKEGFTGMWPDFKKTEITGSNVIEAVYTARLSVIESAEKRGDTAMSLVIAEGDFTTDSVLTLVPVTDDLPAAPGGTVLEAWTVSVSGGEGERLQTIRYRIPELTDPVVGTLEILIRRDNAWEPVETETRGSYTILETDGDTMTFCAMEKEGRTGSPLIYAVIGGGLLMLLLAVLLLRGRRKKNRIASRSGKVISSILLLTLLFTGFGPVFGSASGMSVCSDCGRLFVPETFAEDAGTVDQTGGLPQASGADPTASDALSGSAAEIPEPVNTLPPTIDRNLFPDYAPRENDRAEKSAPEEEEIAQSARTTLESLSGSRGDGVITILCCGIDDASMSTDTMIVGKIDTKAHTMDFVSIPRDLLINVPWDCRKLNSVYAGSKGGEEGIKALLLQIKRITGFDVDCYAFIDLFCFSWAIEALGGVWFDVPCEMSYIDEAQDLYIDLQPGYQLLNPYEAMGLVRYRYTYENGDIDRIELQHSFLKSVMSQLISAGNIPNLPFLLRVARENMQTNLSTGNMAWLAFQLLRTDEENINFFTMPVDTFYLRDYSYAVCRVWDWLPLVNEHLNPTGEDLGWGNVDLVYYNGEKYAGTQGYLAEDWYYDWP